MPRPEQIADHKLSPPDAGFSLSIQATPSVTFVTAEYSRIRPDCPPQIYTASHLALHNTHYARKQHKLRYNLNGGVSNSDKAPSPRKASAMRLRIQYHQYAK